MAAILISLDQAKTLGLVLPAWHISNATLMQIGGSDYEFVLVCLESKQFIVGDYDKLNNNHGHLERCSVVLNSLHELQHYPFKDITFETLNGYKIEFTDTEIKITETIGNNVATVEFHQDDSWWDMFMGAGGIDVMNVYGVL